MRANSFPIRSSREFLDPSPSLPDDEANGVSTTHCDAGVAVVPHKKRHCLGIIETDRGGSSMEPLNFDSCIVCEISDKRVSRCSGIDCFLSFHRECLYAELGSSSEHLENPYCPYCWLKILALKSNSLREKTVGAENAVFKYLDKEMKSRDEDTTLAGDENGNQEQYSMDRAAENFQDAEDNETAKDAGNKGDVSPFLSMHESFSGKEQDQVQQNEKPRRRRRRLIEINTDSETSSKESSNERNGEDVTEKITLSAQVTSPSGMMKNKQRQPTATTKVVVAKPKTVRDISFFKDQRRKLYWTLEEEEMLKVGVEKFAAEAKKNMPWRKILEMGEKVFHETRTPSDLKDKWRNMVGARTVTSSK
ncbi:hypothetical protein V5N11_002720 [Cardamine amara subsp. amara]|uniref:Myb-like domain-containing protein n=1 Tax=Cardamine amara subsp. amara TaxID=228776 RepID=A0ABD1AP80_CARAN